jgi:hypothetical protein
VAAETALVFEVTGSKLRLYFYFHFQVPSWEIAADENILGLILQNVLLISKDSFKERFSGVSYFVPVRPETILSKYGQNCLPQKTFLSNCQGFLHEKIF